MLIATDLQEIGVCQHRCLSCLVYGRYRLKSSYYLIMLARVLVSPAASWIWPLALALVSASGDSCAQTQYPFRATWGSRPIGHREAPSLRGLHLCAPLSARMCCGPPWFPNSLPSTCTAAHPQIMGTCWMLTCVHTSTRSYMQRRLQIPWGVWIVHRHADLLLLLVYMHCAHCAATEDHYCSPSFE